MSEQMMKVESQCKSLENELLVAREENEVIRVETETVTVEQRASSPTNEEIQQLRASVMEKEQQFTDSVAKLNETCEELTISQEKLSAAEASLLVSKYFFDILRE